MTFLALNHNYNLQNFQVFGSVRTRRQDPVLQASATTFINNIQAQYPGEHFLWSDGAYLVTLRNQVLQTSSATYNQQCYRRNMWYYQ